MRLIGLHARLHAGKDTAYETIRQATEDQSLLAVRRAFADPLKVSGMRTLGISGEGEDAERALAMANRIKETGHITASWVDAKGYMRAIAVSGRQFWQYYGTEAHRADDLGSSFGPNFWVDNLLPLGTASMVRDDNPRPLFWDNFKESWAGYADIAVVTDVRFPNEAQRILDLDGEVWKIDADDRLGPNEDAHASEIPLPDDLVTRVIDNNGSLVEFQNGILEALHS